MFGCMLLCTDVVGCAVVCGCVLASVDSGLYVYGCVDVFIYWCVSVVCVSEFVWSMWKCDMWILVYVDI